MTSDKTSKTRPTSAADVHAELITPEPARALAGVLGITSPFPLEDGALPPLWHWVYLLDRRPQSDLGTDGHPRHGVPAPPGPRLRRMFAGGRVTMHAPLTFGQVATRTTRVINTREVEGRSGPLTFVTTSSDIEQGGVLTISDEQDIVYRMPGPTQSSPSAPLSFLRPPTGVEQLEIEVDPVLLFRFSALTYNAHRIHYDRPYVTTEGYPDLLVHGPLQALLMGEVIRRSEIPVVGRQFAYRLIRPTFGAQRITARLCDEDDRPQAYVTDGEGHVTATSTIRETTSSLSIE